MRVAIDPLEPRTGIRRIDFVEQWYNASSLVDGLPGKELRSELHGWSTQLGKQTWVADDFGARAATLATTMKTNSYPSDEEHWTRVGQLYGTFGIHLARFTTSTYVQLQSERPTIRGDRRALAKVSTAIRAVPVHARKFMIGVEFPGGPVTYPRARLEDFLATADEYEQRVHDWCRRELTYYLRRILDDVEAAIARDRAAPTAQATADTLREAIDELLMLFGEPKQQPLRAPTPEEQNRAYQEIKAAFPPDSFRKTIQHWTNATGVPDAEIRDKAFAKALSGYLSKIIRGKPWNPKNVVSTCITDIGYELYLKKLNRIRHETSPAPQPRRTAPSGSLSDEAVHIFEEMHTTLVEYPLYAPDGSQPAWEKQTVLALLREWLDSRDERLLDDAAVFLEWFAAAEQKWRDGAGPADAATDSAPKAFQAMKAMWATGLQPW